MMVALGSQGLVTIIFDYFFAILSSTAYDLITCLQGNHISQEAETDTKKAKERSSDSIALTLT